MKRYQPRRAGAQWLKGAPREILDCFDSGENAGADRYTVIMADPYIYHLNKAGDIIQGAGEFKNTWLAYLGSSAEMGVSGWGEFEAYQAAAYRFANGHRRIKWAAVPPTIRRYLVSEIRSDAREAAAEKAKAAKPAKVAKPKRKPRLYLDYMGVTIWRNTEPGPRLPWSATGYGAADTLAGMKELIREAKAAD